MVKEVRIQVTFTTGTTVDDPEKAKESCLELLQTKLEEADVISRQDIPRGLFFFKVDKVEVEEL